MDDDRFKRWNNSLTLVAAGFGLIASLLGGFNTWQTRALEARFKEAEESRKQLEFELKYRKDVYDEVKALLKEQITVQKARLVLTLVSSLPVARDRADQQLFFNNVQELVKEMIPTDNSPDDVKVRRLILDKTQEHGLRAAQQMAKVPLPPDFFQAERTVVVSEKGWDIDIFYCAAVASEAANRVLAEKALDHLRTAGDVGRLRLRKLPPEINGLPEYGGRGLMIRADDDAREQVRARKLAVELESAGIKGFRVEPNASRSAWYLSAFVCPA